MVMASIFMSMVQDTKVNGRMTCNMELAKRLGLMVLYMKENIWLERNMEKEFIAGMMDLDTRVNGMRIRLKEMAHIHG